MRLFGYYAIHTFWNQIRKLLRASIIIFIVVCGLIGGLIGYGTASLEDHAESEAVIEMEDEDYVDEEDIDIATILEEEDLTDSKIDFTDEGLSLLQADGSRMVFDFNALLEAGAMVVILAILFFCLFSADKSGSSIFLMADVNLLFASPLKPQSVLLFRLMNRMGMTFFASAYFLFQVPNLVLNAGMSLLSCMMIIVVWFGSLVIAELLQILLFTIFTTHTSYKKYLVPGLGGILALLFCCILAFSKIRHLTYLAGAITFFTLPATRWIPFVGWLKGLLMYAVEGNNLMSCVMAAILLVCSGLLTYGIWQVKADFYEEAMTQSEKKENQLRDAKEGRTIVSSRRKKKDRSEKLKRDEFNHGWGANVFFTKTMYNRIRFAKFGIFTKTNVTYLLVCGGALFASTFFTGEMNFLFVALALGVFVFYRALGNPLAEDVEMSFFLMSPVNLWAKLFWSLLAGSCTALMDILPAVIVGAVLTKTSPFVALAWTFFLLTVDLYSVIAVTFITICIPKNVSDVVKQLILVLFIYFGLLPDIALIVMGIVLHHRVTYTCLAGLVNVLLALIFFLIIPAILDPMGVIRPRVAPISEEKRRVIKKRIAWIGLSVSMIPIITNVLQLVAVRLVDQFLPDLLTATSYGMWLVTFLPQYAVAVPICLLLIKKVPAVKITEGKWKPLAMLQIFPMCCFVMYVGNIVGMIVNYVLSLFVHTEIGNPLMTIAGEDNVWMKFLFMVILAPLIEEFIFRKTLITRLQLYGEKVAVITSAVMFGLIHGNFSQFFYATALGLIFGYVYIRSGKLRYSVGLHMIINFMGGILSIWLVEKFTAEMENLEIMFDAIDQGEKIHPGFGVIAFLIYIVCILLLAITGMVLLILNWHKLTFPATGEELGRGQILKTVWLNWGMIVFVLVNAVSFVMVILQG
ncbi:MAG: CPBP family glutamic-type intramembrane protease [Dorea sp.]|nr:CPBP family glutamic-type intramembrane protease [Dorea sp.]